MNFLSRLQRLLDRLARIDNIGYCPPQSEDMISEDIECYHTHILDFEPPFRVGRKQGRSVLDNKGHEVVIFPMGHELMAKNYCDFLNI